jgi:hypothetical protein
MKYFFDLMILKILQHQLVRTAYHLFDFKKEYLIEKYNKSHLT